MLKELNYFLESKRDAGNPLWNLLILNKDLIYRPVHYLCLVKPCRDMIYRTFGTTGAYEPHNRGILSADYRFIYFYIPKVASTSIKKSLARILHGRDIGSGIHGFRFDEALDVTLGEYTDFFKFSLVRNPWDRLVSCYADKILAQRITNSEYHEGVYRKFRKRYNGLFYPGMSFGDFVEAVAAIPDQEADRHFRSQYTYHTDREGHTLTDFVGKFENIEADLEYIRARTDLPDLNLSQERVSNRAKDYRGMYSEKTRKMAAVRFKEDIERFHYSF